MTTHAAPDVDCVQQHPLLYVSDLLAAIDFYTTKLGFRHGFTWGDPPDMAGVNLGDVSIHLMEGTPTPDGCALYFVIGDADALYEYQLANGVEIVRPPQDMPWGMRDYRVRDLYGHLLGFGHNLAEKLGPPLEIERVDVNVRMEKRLAALLNDLAAHKHMTLTSCVEEILLHTNEPYGTGVASPHTTADLRYIQELKKKHGIDYDSHGSYRFVEKL
jgi:uncharacterized glyoxalase superfamily protein PhnB